MKDVVGRVVECQHCGHSFCRRHGDNVHPPSQSCAEYDAQQQRQQQQQEEEEEEGPNGEQQRQQQQPQQSSSLSGPSLEQQTQQLIADTTKPCSRCGALVAKVAGCDHIICTNCHEDFCWKCGSHEHLTGVTIRTCSRCDASYVDHRHLATYRCYIILLFLGLLPLSLLYIAFTLLLSLLTCGCCGALCCTGTNKGSPQERRELGIALWAIVLMPVFAFSESMGLVHIDPNLLESASERLEGGGNAGAANNSNNSQRRRNDDTATERIARDEENQAL